MTARYKPRPPLNGPEVEAALSAMPERFQNVHFRQALGVTPSDASEMLAILQNHRRVVHPDTNTKWWTVAKAR